MAAPAHNQSAFQPGAAPGNAATGSNVIGIIGGGRTAVGDRRPATKPAIPIVAPAPPPVAKYPAMGCSGYRIKHGTSDEAIVKAIREHASKSVAETEGSPWIAASSLTDEQILSVIGWSVFAKTACARVAKHLIEMSS
jgi:hypothetical protein